MMSLAGREGFGAVTRARLAEAAGVDVDAVDRHVTTLDQLLADAYSDAVDRLFLIYVAGFDSAEDWAPRFAAAATAVADTYALDPPLARVCEREVNVAGPAARAAKAAATTRLVAFVAERLADGTGVPPLHVELVCGALTQTFAEELEAGHLDALAARALDVAAMFAPEPAPAY